MQTLTRTALADLAATALADLAATDDAAKPTQIQTPFLNIEILKY